MYISVDGGYENTTVCIYLFIYTCVCVFRELRFLLALRPPNTYYSSLYFSKTRTCITIIASIGRDALAVDRNMSDH